MTQGSLDEAKQLVESASEHQPSGLAGFFKRVVNRFEDPAAALVPRYLGLRTREDTIFNTLGQFLLDSFQQELTDVFVISAELAAREQQYKITAQRILNIRPGGLPLFTEGFLC